MLVESPIRDEKSPTAIAPKRYVRFVVTLGLALLVISAWKVKATGQPPFLHRENVWSVARYEGPSPLDLHPTSPNNVPLLTSQHVSDMDALFLADPFMVQDGPHSYLFLEVLNRDTNQGDIAVAISDDGGESWRYEKTVLDEPWHLSYPLVLSVDGSWYMTPQTDAGVYLYEAEEFPWKWKRCATLLEGTTWADPTLFQHDGSWWMFVGRSGTHDELRLYFADQIRGPWQEHPQSPLIQDDPEKARPGGRVIEFDGSLYRFAQDCAPKYGNQLRAFRITTLNRKVYQEELVPDEFVLRAGSHGWNANGMHHLDAHQRPDGSWFAIVDGHKKTWVWSWTP